MIIRNWGYGESDDSGKTRRSVRFVGRMNQATFIRTVLDNGRTGSKWIKDRMCDTGNDFELSLIAKYPDKVVKYDNRTHEILEIRDKV